MFQTNNSLLVPMRRRVAGGAAFEYVSNNSVNNINGTSHTFTDQDIGVADTGRLVIVAFAGGASKDTTSVTVTIGGVATTELFLNNTAADDELSGFAWAVVPTGITGDIVFTFNSGGGYKMQGFGIVVYRAVGFGTGPDSTDSAAFESATQSKAYGPTPDGGVIIVTGANDGTGVPSLIIAENNLSISLTNCDVLIGANYPDWGSYNIVDVQRFSPGDGADICTYSMTLTPA